jgi:hypothetical protein
MSSRRANQPDDLSGYRETPARRVLLVEGRQACYRRPARLRVGRERVVAVTDGQPCARTSRELHVPVAVRTPAERGFLVAAPPDLQSDDEEKEAISDGKADSSEG